MRRSAPRAGSVPLARALSKLGVASRSRAVALILEGRVRIDGRVVRDSGKRVVPERARLDLDAAPAAAAPWKAILFHKPRGVVTTARDPEGRRTVYDVLGDAGPGVMPVGRLDRASTGLLLLTSDTRLAAWLTDPARAVPRTYVVTVRGDVSDATRNALEQGMTVGGQVLTASKVDVRKVDVRKRSRRETHVVVTLRAGKGGDARRPVAGRRRMPQHARLVTAEELEHFPDDDYRYELVEGHVIKMSPTGVAHGIVTMNLGARLWRHIKAHDAGVLMNETGFTLARDPDTVRAPDLSFVRRERVLAEGLRGAASGKARPIWRSKCSRRTIVQRTFARRSTDT